MQCDGPARNKTPGQSTLEDTAFLSWTCGLSVSFIHSFRVHDSFTYVRTCDKPFPQLSTLCVRSPVAASCCAMYSPYGKGCHQQHQYQWYENGGKGSGKSNGKGQYQYSTKGKGGGQYHHPPPPPPQPQPSFGQALQTCQSAFGEAMALGQLVNLGSQMAQLPGAHCLGAGDYGQWNGWNPVRLFCAKQSDVCPKSSAIF